MDSLSLILIIIVLILAPFVWSGFSLAPLIFTSKKDLTRIHNLADLKPGENFYEIGSGFGFVSRFMAMQNPKAQIFGIEMAFPAYIVSVCIQKLRPLSNIQFLRKNAFRTSLEKAHVIYIYGLNKVPKKFAEKFQQELQLKTRVISYRFPIESLTPVKIDKPSINEATIYVYSM